MSHLLQSELPGSNDVLRASPWPRPSPPLLLDPLTMPLWDARVEQTPGGSVFHSAGWARVLSNTYGHRPYYLGIPGVEGFVALLPMMEVDSGLLGKWGVSLPFTDLCVPLGGLSEFQILFQHAIEVGRARGWRYIELRGLPSQWLGKQPSLSFWDHTLNLDRPEAEIHGDLDDGVRRAIQEAEQELEVSLGETSEDMRAFYDLYCGTCARDGVPPQSWRFFEHLRKHLVAAEQGFVVVARHAGRPVAGAVFLHFGQNAFLKFGASDSQHQELRGHYIVLWRGIKGCRQRRCRILHFGRTSFTNERQRKFKLGFGTLEFQVNYLRLELNGLTSVKMNNIAHGPMKVLFRLLPRTAARWVGGAIYPHVS